MGKYTSFNVLITYVLKFLAYFVLHHTTVNHILSSTHVEKFVLYIYWSKAKYLLSVFIGGSPSSTLQAYVDANNPHYSWVYLFTAFSIDRL